MTINPYKIKSTQKNLDEVNNKLREEADHLMLLLSEIDSLENRLFNYRPILSRRPIKLILWQRLSRGVHILHRREKDRIRRKTGRLLWSQGILWLRQAKNAQKQVLTKVVRALQPKTRESRQ